MKIKENKKYTIELTEEELKLIEQSLIECKRNAPLLNQFEYRDMLVSIWNIQRKERKEI